MCDVGIAAGRMLASFTIQYYPCRADRYSRSDICSTILFRWQSECVIIHPMIDEFLKKNAINSHKNQDITVCNVYDLEAGIQLAKSFLYDIVDKQSVLYLSGGSMQRLYELLARESSIMPGAV